jgi:hypothetical protein
MWHESIDQRPGRCPVVRATGRDVVYELRMQGGVMSTGLFTPAPNTRLSLRCDEAGNVFVHISNGRKPS